MSSVTCMSPSSPSSVLRIHPNGFTSTTVPVTTSPGSSTRFSRSTRSRAASIAALFGPKTPTTACAPPGGGCVMLTFAPVVSSMSRMFLPCGPMSFPSKPTSIVVFANLGAVTGSSCSRFGAAIAVVMRRMISARATRDVSSASMSTSKGIPSGLQSSWIPVTPESVPAILKSMSPSTSSRPIRSAMIAWRVTSPVASSSSMTSPTETAPTCSARGTPASISAIDPAHTAAIDELPFDSSVSAFTRATNGHASALGSIAANDFSARAPWPISRRLSAGPRRGVSSMENEGNA